MTLREPRAFVESYLQSDADLRATMFPAFVKHLREEASTGSAAEARNLACRAVSPDLDYTSLLTLGRLLRSLPAPAESKARLRLAVMGGPTTTQLVELLRVFLAGANLAVEVHEGEYGVFRQEILIEGSALDRFQPSLVLVATGARDVARWPSLADSAQAVTELLDAEVADWSRLWKRAQDRWGATVIQNTFEIPPGSVMGHFAVRHPGSRESFLRRLNQRFAERAPAHVVLHDLQALATETGAREWFDARFYLEAKMPCGPESLATYAHSVSRVVVAVAGKSRKVLVLDLDNTLWGGVIGDAGVEGIEIGQGSGVGEAFVEFQKYARDLRERGILLAVCSKNEASTARLPFEKHDGMILKLTDFSCFVANWQSKADNLREIARALELGLDSLVLVDDNPAERALVRRLVPDVAVPDMPEDPGGYVMALARQRYFETVAWTTEDAQRAVYYEQNAQRKEWAAQSTDVDAFLDSLEMRARVGPVSRLNVERVAQLVNKSNQFNVTTRRRTPAEIEKLEADPQWTTLTVSLADKLGDNGLISVVFLRQSGSELVIDTWLMSCRVLQRGVEHLVLNEVVENCRERKCCRIRGVFIPTERNALVRNLFADLGFTRAGEEGSSSLWTLAVDDTTVTRPTHIQKENAHA